MRTTSHGSGKTEGRSGVAASPPDRPSQLQSQFSGADPPTSFTGPGVPKTAHGLAMSQTRTTTHTSNQHNSGGNVAAA